MRDYDLFIRDWINDYNPGVVQYIQTDESVEPFDEDKDPVFKEGFIFRDKLQIPIVSLVLAKPRNRESVIAFTSKFMDDHVNELSAVGPVDIFTFGQKEVQPLYDLFGVSADQLIGIYEEVVKETYYGKISKFFTGWVHNAPHKILLTAMAVEAILHNYDDILDCVEYLYGFTEYPIIYREYWKFGVREDVMAYTIEHLGNKYKVKHMQNLQGLLKYDTTQVFDSYAEQLKTGKDNLYMDIMYRIRNRINDKFKNISRNYYKNIESNATLHMNQTTYDDGSLTDQQGMASTMAAIIDKTVGKVEAGEVNSGMVRIAANHANADAANLQAMIGQIQAAKNNKVDRFVENVITYYFKKNPNTSTLMSNDFLNFGLALYRSIGVSKDPLLVEIKDIVKHWTDDIIDLKGTYGSKGTISIYSRAISDYYILMINYVQ